MKQRVPIDSRSASLRHHHRRAISFRAQGLTTKGRPFKRHPNFSSAAKRKEFERRRNLSKWNGLVVQRQLAGLTTRGTAPIYKLMRDYSENDSLILAARIDATMAGIGRIFDSLPHAVRAQCVELASHLAAIKRRII